MKKNRFKVIVLILYEAEESIKTGLINSYTSNVETQMFPKSNNTGKH